ncbi:probable methyltransferase-like protein 24 [Mytilus californianus]|uniref:probable methyltransferase-like protein 24 n=1 Tax=Mytilus californianus TaxID=6549 RepID=UPI002246593A|nr:probable methyltransferase-like protein 24 [Mytilus californianus]
MKRVSPVNISKLDPSNDWKMALMEIATINYNFLFDDAMAELGCEVHSFDPSMGNTMEHVRPNGVHFHPIGIGGSTNDLFSPRNDRYTKKNPKQVWKVRTLRQIMESLGHQDKYFDILKMDIEYYEWEALESILKDNLTARIRQLDIEFHIFPDTSNTKIANFLKIYQTFKEAGFRRYASKMNYYKTNEKRIQTDCEYVNLKFDFNKYQVL